MVVASRCLRSLEQTEINLSEKKVGGSGFRLYKVDEENGESGASTSGDDKNSPDSEPDAISWANRWATAFLMLPEER